jgi:hypothetical protein
MDIISAYREVGSYRGAAAMCATTPKTVRRVIERHEAGGVGPEHKPRGRNYESVAELVAKKVTATQARISAKRLLPEMRAAHPLDGRNRCERLHIARIVAHETYVRRRQHQAMSTPTTGHPTVRYFGGATAAAGTRPSGLPSARSTPGPTGAPPAAADVLAHDPEGHDPEGHDHDTEHVPPGGRVGRLGLPAHRRRPCPLLRPPTPRRNRRTTWGS